jgi:hypothetical protein
MAIAPAFVTELDATESGAAAAAATETEGDVMGVTSKELGKF